MINLKKYNLKGLILLKPIIFKDARGYFYENYNQNKLNNIIGKKIEFCQDNVSRSKKNVLRGLHYQIPPFAQDKLISVIKGKIFDVVIDIRKNSQTYGRWISIILSEKNKRQLWIPKGFAHGFLSLSDDTEVIYKCTNKYSKAHERHINWDNKDIGIRWPIKNPIMSFKDQKKVDFNKLESF